MSDPSKPSLDPPRRQERIRSVLPLKIWGQDATGKPFNQPAFTMDVTPNGARIGGVKQELKVGDVIQVARGATKTKCRVTWTAKHANGLNEVGIELLEPQKNIWAVALPKAQPDQFTGKRNGTEPASTSSEGSAQDAKPPASDTAGKDQMGAGSNGESAEHINPFAVAPPEIAIGGNSVHEPVTASSDASGSAINPSSSAERLSNVEEAIVSPTATSSRKSDEQQTKGSSTTSDSDTQIDTRAGKMEAHADAAAESTDKQSPANAVQTPIKSISVTPAEADRAPKGDSMPTHRTEKLMSSLQSVALPVSDGAEPAIDQIRNILLGQQMRAYEARFAKVSDKIAGEFNDIRDMVRQRTEELERSSARQTETLAVRLRAEENARLDLSKDSVREIKAASDALFSKVEELERSTSSANHDARQKQAAESARLMDQLKRTQDELQNLIRQQVADLRHSKVDRSVLATLLEDVVKQITSNDAADESVAAALIANSLTIRPSSGASARRKEGDPAVKEQLSVAVESARRPVTSTDSAN